MSAEGVMTDIMNLGIRTEGIIVIGGIQGVDIQGQDQVTKIDGHEYTLWKRSCDVKYSCC